MGYVPESVDYDMYAKMDYWSFEEALRITVSYKLHQGTYNCKEDYQIEYDKEFSKLDLILYRSIQSSAIGEYAVVYNNDALPSPVLDISFVTPYWFKEWITDKKYELPKEIAEIELTDIGLKDIQSMIDTIHNNYIFGGLVAYDIEGDEFMSIEEIEEKCREIDLKNGSTKSINEIKSKSDSSAVAVTSVNDIADHKYRFIKTTQSWELEFEHVLLKGVKHLAGMDYIKILLQNPNVKISVFELQAMLNPATRQKEMEPGEDSQGPVPFAGNKKSSKSVSLKNLNNRLLALSKEREELEEYELFEQERIDSEVAQIEEDIDRIRYSRAGDDNPEIKSNRDKVYNCIRDARENIKNQEIREGYKDTPLYNFLKLHIKTGSAPCYTPPIVDPPQWSC